MLYTVTFNPSLDYYVKVNNLKSGIVNRTSTEYITVGGKGLNVSLALKELGDTFTTEETNKLTEAKAGIADLEAAVETLAGEMAALKDPTDAETPIQYADKAALEAILRAGKASGSPLLEFYAEHTVATADIKIAVRCQKTGKSLGFLQRALVECDTLDITQLAQAAVESFEAITGYLIHTCYGGAAEALCQSVSAFERWCDNRLIEKIRPQKYETSTIDPIAAWLLARENEIKTVRILLSGKRNGLSDDAIRERLREMYV